MVKKISKLVVAAAMVTLLAGCAGTASKESTGEYLDNTAITAKIKADLAMADETSAMDIEVDTFKNTVMLSGFVDSEAEKMAAQKIAEEVEGVVTVKNALVVK